MVIYFSLSKVAGTIITLTLPETMVVEGSQEELMQAGHGWNWLLRYSAGGTASGPTLYSYPKTVIFTALLYTTSKTRQSGFLLKRIALIKTKTSEKVTPVTPEFKRKGVIWVEVIVYSMCLLLQKAKSI